MSRTIIHRLGVSSVLLLAVAIAGCNRGETQAEAPQRPPPVVSAVPAISRDVPIYLDAIGKTVGVEVVSIIPQVGGKVIATHVENGAYVKKGDLLFEIDPQPFQAELDAAKATLAQSKAELLWAQADFTRTEELLSTKVVSQLEFDQKKSNLGVVQAKIAGGDAAVQTAELNLRYTKIHSPLDGRAGVRFVDAGNIVKENEGVMLIIQRLDPIYAEFTVTENDLGTVRKYLSTRGLAVGNEASMGLKAMVDVPGNSERILNALGSATTRPGDSTAGPREGVLTFLDNTVQTNTGTVKLRATVPNADRYFWPGQFVNVRLILSTRKNAVLIPMTAQQIGQQGPFVYVVKPDSTVEQRVIRPGQPQGELMVVDSGVTSGEQVVTVGQMMIQPGAKVQVMPAEGAPPAAASATGEKTGV